MKIKFDNVIDQKNDVWWVDVFLPTAMNPDGKVPPNNRRSYISNIGNDTAKNHLKKVLIYHYKDKNCFGGELILPLPGDIFELDILGYLTTISAEKDTELHLRFRDGLESTYQFKSEELTLLVTETVLYQIYGHLSENVKDWKMP